MNFSEALFIDFKPIQLRTGARRFRPFISADCDILFHIPHTQAFRLTPVLYYPFGIRQIALFRFTAEAWAYFSSPVKNAVEKWASDEPVKSADEAKNIDALFKNCHSFTYTPYALRLKLRHWVSDAEFD
jgi:hypothetical protein